MRARGREGAGGPAGPGEGGKRARAMWPAARLSAALREHVLGGLHAPHIEALVAAYGRPAVGMRASFVERFSLLRGQPHLYGVSVLHPYAPDGLRAGPLDSLVQHRALETGESSGLTAGSVALPKLTLRLRDGGVVQFFLWESELTIWSDPVHCTVWVPYRDGQSLMCCCVGGGDSCYLVGTAFYLENPRDQQRTAFVLRVSGIEATLLHFGTRFGTATGRARTEAHDYVPPALHAITCVATDLQRLLPDLVSAEFVPATCGLAKDTLFALDSAGAIHAIDVATGGVEQIWGRLAPQAESAVLTAMPLTTDKNADGFLAAVASDFAADPANGRLLLLLDQGTRIASMELPPQLASRPCPPSCSPACGCCLPPS